MGDFEATVVVLIPYPSRPIAANNQPPAVIDRRKASVKFDAIAPSACRDFPIRKSAVICGVGRRGVFVCWFTIELTNNDGIAR